MRLIVAGILTAFVGFASSFVVIIKGPTAIGANDAEAASGLITLSMYRAGSALMRRRSQRSLRPTPPQIRPNAGSPPRLQARLMSSLTS
jgi:hypothetical protein